MKKTTSAKSRCQNEDLAEIATIAFPARFRVRCPRCSAERQAPRNTGEPGRYLCESTDRVQSDDCLTRAKAQRTAALVAEAREILGKIRFGAPAAPAPFYVVN